MGKVAAADGRHVVSLDEIGELPWAIQARLLRLLQERDYERFGENIRGTQTSGSSPRPTEIWLRQLRKPAFREDLYYRLNVISLRMPPLRERAADIERLALVYLNFAASHSGKSVRTFAPAALEALRSYSWPGNLRNCETSSNAPSSLATMNESRSMISPISFARPRSASRRRIHARADRGRAYPPPNLPGTKPPRKSPISFKSTRRHFIERERKFRVVVIPSTSILRLSANNVLGETFLLSSSENSFALKKSWRNFSSAKGRPGMKTLHLTS